MNEWISKQNHQFMEQYQPRPSEHYHIITLSDHNKQYNTKIKIGKLCLFFYCFIIDYIEYEEGRTGRISSVLH